nr:F0F1 ATP synthase subunit B [Microcystis flos-aquae]
MAQIVNFLILVAVLQKFLYRPIIQAMERREKTISDRQQDAEQKCQLAREEIEKYQQMQQDFATERSTMLAQVRAAVAQTQTELMQGIRTEVEEDRSRWQEIVQRQKDAFLQELRHRALQQIQETIRQVLAALADVQLEQLVIQVFLKRVRNWDREEKRVLCQAIAATAKTQEAIISSSFEISEELRQPIISVLRQELVGDLDFKG